VSLIAAWDDGVYDTIIPAGDATKRAQRAATFAKLRAAHGACAATSYTRTNDKHAFGLTCDRGGDLRLEVVRAENAEKDEDGAADFSIAAVANGGACPVK
jgi:hypothetical protein